MMKRIAILHYKVGDTDGVSLEIDKWRIVLENLGHEVYLCAGSLGSTRGTLIKQMFHQTPEAKRLYANTFIALQGSEEAYKAELKKVARKIEKKLSSFIEEKRIDILIPHNIWSVGMNPAAALALAHVVEKFKLPVLAQHHDFYWERINGVALTCSTAVELADKYLPPRNPFIRHAVINSLAQANLKDRKGIESVIIPNIFDFEGPDWQKDDFNRDFRSRIGVGENDIIILQATRLVRRKGVELAVDFVKALNDPQRRAVLEKEGLYDGRAFSEDDRIILVLAGYAHDDPGGTYVSALKQKIHEAGIDAIFIENIVGRERFKDELLKVYSLWDTYVFADFITYPSLWEGWGNQLLEAVRARVPFLIFEYPVYRADIKEKGLKAVSLGGKIAATDSAGLVQVKQKQIDKAADTAVCLLTDGKMRRSVVRHNFEVASGYYSMASLQRQLNELVGTM
jgi:glycosyltransferase involved in cell wall biosynthesis